ncbi:MAG TPA: AAA family ATPase, partial [Mariprofundaceae bacterium]|nr:AAA family ATPase [Mariprofundaceae bacterium]
MLTSLTVREFALMEKVSLEFAPGMTAFTGETGAGKSILIDALGAAFGARASSDWVRHGAERAEVTATWQGEDARLAGILAGQEIEAEEELILRRIIGADGRSRAFVNGTPVPMRVLQEIGEVCLDLHGQHEHQVLLQPEFQRAVLDALLEPSLLAAVGKAFHDWRQAHERLASLQHERGDTEQQAAWMREELERLRELNIEEGLAETLQAEVDVGRNHAQIQQAAAQALALLDEGEPSARQLIAAAAHAIDKAVEFHAGLRDTAEMIGQLDAILGEAGHGLRGVLDASFDEAALQAAEERLLRLHEAMRRHKTDEAGLLALA